MFLNKLNIICSQFVTLFASCSTYDRYNVPKHLYFLVTTSVFSCFWTMADISLKERIFLSNLDLSFLLFSDTLEKLLW